MFIIYKIALIIYSIVLTMGSKDLAMRAQCCSGDGQAQDVAVQKMGLQREEDGDLDAPKKKKYSDDYNIYERY